MVKTTHEELRGQPREPTNAAVRACSYCRFVSRTLLVSWPASPALVATATIASSVATSIISLILAQLATTSYLEAMA